eukprot:gene11435-4602_t
MQSVSLYKNENIDLIKKSKKIIEEHLNSFKGHQQNINKTIKYFSVLVETHLNLIEHEKETNMKKKEKLNQKIEKQTEFLQEKEEIDFELLYQFQRCFYVNDVNSIFSIEPNLSLKSDNITFINHKLQNFLQTYEQRINLTKFEKIENKKKKKETEFNKEEFDFFMFKDPYIDEQYKFETLKKILQSLEISVNFNRVDELLSKDEKDYLIEFNQFEMDLLKKHPNLFRPNEPVNKFERKIGNVEYKIHRNLLRIPLLFQSNQNETGYSCLQSIVSMYSNVFQNFFEIPKIEEMKNIIEINDLPFEKIEKYPENEMNDIPNLSMKHGLKNENLLSSEQFLYLSKHYLPYLYSNEIKFENSIQKRGELVYQILKYFCLEPEAKDSYHIEVNEENIKDEMNQWKFVQNSQYPIVIKRNSQFSLVLGVKWGKYLNVKKEIENWKSKGIGALQYDRNHFNSYPYFNRKGNELIQSNQPINKENITEPINKKKEAMKILMLKGKEFPYLIPLKKWIYNPKISQVKLKETMIFNELFLDEALINKEARLGILEGRCSIFEYLLDKNPLSILNSVLNFVENWNDENFRLQKIGIKEYSKELLIHSKNEEKCIEIHDINSQFGYFLNKAMKYNKDYKTYFETIQQNITKYQKYSELRDLFPVQFTFKNNEKIEFTNPNFNNWPSKISQMRKSLCLLFPFLKLWENKSTDGEILKFIDFLFEESEIFQFSSRKSTNDIQLDLTTNYLLDNELTPYFKGIEMELIKEKSTNFIFSSIPIHEEFSKKKHLEQNSFRILIPKLLLTIRQNVYEYRRQKYYMKLFLKGILVPENETILKEYMSQKIKEYLTENKDDKYLTLKSRMLNAKIEKRIFELRPPPTTREVIKKFVKAYQIPSENILNPKVEKIENSIFELIKSTLGLEKISNISISNKKLSKIIEMFTNKEKLGLKMKKSNNPLIDIYKYPKRNQEMEEEFFDIKIFIFYLIESIYSDIFKNNIKEELFPLLNFDIESKVIDYLSSVPQDVNLQESTNKDFGTLKYYQNRVSQFYSKIEMKFTKKNERENGISLFKSPMIFNGKPVLKLISSKKNIQEIKNQKFNEMIKTMSRVDTYVTDLIFKRTNEFTKKKENLDHKFRSLFQKIPLITEMNPKNEDIFPVQIKEIENIQLNFMDRFACLNIFDVIIPSEEFDSSLYRDPEFQKFKLNQLKDCSLFTTSPFPSIMNNEKEIENWKRLTESLSNIPEDEFIKELKHSLKFMSPKQFLPPLYPLYAKELSSGSIIHEKMMEAENHWNQFIEEYQQNEIEKSIIHRSKCFKLLHEIGFEILKNRNSIQEVFLELDYGKPKELDILHPHLYFPSDSNIHFGHLQVEVSKISLINFNLQTGVLSELISNETLLNPNNLMKLIIQSKKNHISNSLFNISLKIYEYQNEQTDIFDISNWILQTKEEICILIEKFSKNIQMKDMNRIFIVEYLTRKNEEWNHFVDKIEKRMPELKVIFEKISIEEEEIQQLNNQNDEIHSLNNDETDLLIFRLNIKRCKRIIETEEKPTSSEYQKEIKDLINSIVSIIVPPKLKKFEPNIQSLLKNLGIYSKRNQSSKYQKILEILKQLTLIFDKMDENEINESYKIIGNQEYHHRSELISISPFIYDIESKVKSNVDENDDFFFLEDQEKKKDHCEGPVVFDSLLDNFSSLIQQPTEKLKEKCDKETFEFDFERVRAYLMSKEKNENWISEEEAALMKHNERPVFYKTKDDQLDSLKEKIDKKSNQRIDTINQIDENLKKGVDLHSSFGGLGGGELELLLYSPNKGESYQISDLIKNSEEYKNIPDLGYFGQPGVGWMNLNDVIGPGIQTYKSVNLSERKFVYTGNKPTEFKYFPGENLSKNEKFMKEEMNLKGGLKYLSHIRNSEDLIRESIPLYDLNFTFFSTFPLK